MADVAGVGMNNDQLDADTVGAFGWCGTCYSYEARKPGYCKHFNVEPMSNTSTDGNSRIKSSSAGLNPEEFSRPEANENWGFCSENCLKLNNNQGYSEVITSKDCACTYSVCHLIMCV